MKKIIGLLLIIAGLALAYLVFVPSGIYIKPQVKSQVTVFAKDPESRKVAALPEVRQALSKLKNPRVTRISDPEGGTKTALNFSFAINGKIFSAEMDQTGPYTWKLVELY